MSPIRTRVTWCFLAGALVSLSAVLPAGSVFAQVTTVDTIHHTEIPQTLPPHSPPPAMFPPYVESDMWLYQPGEFYVDLFAIGATGQGNNFGSSLGGGAAFGWWCTRYIGVMVEGFGADLPNGHDATLLGGVQLRLPVDDAAFAFYIFAEGGGYFADRDGGTFQGGLGVDVRLTQSVSLVFDVRGIDVNNQHNRALTGRAALDEPSADGAILYRLGLRFVF